MDKDRNTGKGSARGTECLPWKEGNEHGAVRKTGGRCPFRQSYRINAGMNGVLMDIAEEQPRAFQLLFFIFENMDERNALICTCAAFEEGLGCSNSTVKRCIRYLKDRGLISVSKCGACNRYVAVGSLVRKPHGGAGRRGLPAGVLLPASGMGTADGGSGK